MKKTKGDNSFRKKMLQNVLGIFIIIVAVVIAYNSYIFYLSKKQVEDLRGKTLELYTDGVASSLERVENFMLTQCLTNEDIQKFRRPRNGLDQYIVQIDVKDRFGGYIDNFNYLDGFFMYDAENDIYVGKTKYQVSSKTQKSVRNNMPRILSGFARMAKEKNNQWYSLPIDDEYYLFRVFETQNIYVGAYIKTTTALSELTDILEGEIDYIYVRDADGKVLDINYSLSEKELKKYSMQEAFSKDGDFSFCILSKKTGVFQRIQQMWLQLAVMIAVLLMVYYIGYAMYRKKLLAPLNGLVEAMTRLGGGDLDTPLPQDVVYSEFQLANDTFDKMRQEIKDLKIEMYEEMLNKQRAELLYLQEQINPHFLTNCINLIRNLAIKKDYEKIQLASVLVSKYMRYTLTNSTMISLESELEHVENYKQLQKMRFGEQFVVDIHMKEELLHFQVPTMLIQTFVDNAIKHQRNPDRILKVDVIIQEKEKDDIEGLSIKIMDSGEGFAEDILEKLQQEDVLQSRVGDKIGIFNVKQRLKILYKGAASLQFYNNEAWNGAVVDIWIPKEHAE